MNESPEMLRARVVQLEKFPGGYGFRIAGHPEDIDEACRRVRVTIPAPLRHYDRLTKRWFVQRAAAAVLAEIFPSFERLREQLELEA